MIISVEETKIVVLVCDDLKK